MGGKSNNNIRKCVEQLIYIVLQAENIYVMAGEKVTKITRRYSRSSLDNPVPDTFPRLEYGTKQQNPDNSNSSCLHGRAMKGSCRKTANKEGCSNRKTTTTQQR